MTITFHPSDRLGPFELGRVVGEGAQSVVWQATDTRNGTTIALKVLRAGLSDATHLARLLREGELLGSLADPGVPRGLVLFLDERAGTVALAMEYIEGETLADVTTQVPPVGVLSLGRELFRILGAVHQHGVVHRDLKPRNVVLRRGWETGRPGTVVLVDFGIAIGTGKHATRHTSPGDAVGTEAYMAPEVLLGKTAASLSPTVDIYSAGVMLWSLLTGMHPTGLSLQSPVSEVLLAYASLKPPKVDPNLAAALEQSMPGFLDVLTKCVEIEPAKRFQSAAAVQEAFDAVSRGPSRATSRLPQVGPAKPSWPPGGAGAAPSPTTGDFTKLPQALHQPYGHSPSTPMPSSTSGARADSSPGAGEFTRLPSGLQQPYGAGNQPALGAVAAAAPVTTAGPPVAHARSTGGSTWPIAIAGGGFLLIVGLVALVWSSASKRRPDSSESEPRHEPADNSDDESTKEKSTADKPASPSTTLFDVSAAHRALSAVSYKTCCNLGPWASEATKHAQCVQANLVVAFAPSGGLLWVDTSQVKKPWSTTCLTACFKLLKVPRFEGEKQHAISWAIKY